MSLEEGGDVLFYRADSDYCVPNAVTSNLVVTSKRAQIEDLDTLPRLDRSLIDYRKYHQYIGQSGIKNCFTVQGSRGCPWRCIYCDVIKLSPRLYRRTPEHVFEEIKYLYNLGVRDIEFIDDIFNVHKKDFMSFFKLLIKNRIRVNVYFQSGLRGDILDADAIDVMMEGGVKSVNISLETASPRLQKLIKKNLNIDKFHKNLSYMVAHYPNAILGINAMHGFPTETEEANQTVNFIKTIKWVHFAQLHNVRIFPGSVLEKIALENGITKQQISESLTLPYNAIPTTFTIDPEFSRRLRLDFVRSYVMNKERLRYVLQKQLEVCTEDELIFKYQSYFPSQINSFDDIFKLARLDRSEVDFSNQPDHSPVPIQYPDLVPYRSKSENSSALRFLFIDATQFYSTDERAELRIVEAPLGGLALLTYLKHQFGERVEGYIAKSFVNFDSHEELINLVKDFKPDLIGVRTMSYYKNFFRDVIQVVRSIDNQVPIIAGGPHPTIAYEEVLEENDIQAVVLGEGELTLAEIVQAMLENDKSFPDSHVLNQIKGLVYRKYH